MSIIVMTDDDFEKNMQRLADRFHPLLAASFRARDTAQREALAQLQAEMPDLRANMTKALDLLQVLTSTKYTHRAFVEAVDEADEMLEQLRGKVVLKGLADQQEAQGVQAADERIALLERELDRERERADMAEVELQSARAALTTQPATGEPAKYWAFHNEFGELRIEDRWDVAKHLPFDLIPLITLITPPAAAHGGITAEVLAPFLAVADSYDPAEDDAHVPAKDWMMDDALRLTLGQFRALKRAAAHGDEAVRFESPEALAKALFDHGSIVTSRLIADRIFAAMRAQGGGEVQ